MIKTKCPLFAPRCLGLISSIVEREREIQDANPRRVVYECVVHVTLFNEQSLFVVSFFLKI